QYTSMTLLGEIGAKELAEAGHLISDETVKKRARHVIEENDRVLLSVKALQSNDLQAFGRLMVSSHESLRDLYEVSCTELDIMVEEALKLEGVLGSRMTGAGFGGCTVSLVRADQVDAFIREVGSQYS